MKNLGRKLVESGQKMRSERGEIDIGAILIMGIGMVFIAVGFIIYPIIITATDALLAYECTACTTVNAAYFTGFTAVTGIVPLLVLIGYLSAGIFAMYLGVKIMKGGGGGGTNLDLGTLLLLGISMIFIAIGLIILPVVLDAICSIIKSGISTSYAGLSPILLVSPLLLLISFIAAAVVTGFFGIKRLGG